MSWASKWNLVWHEKLMVVTTSEGNYFGLACTNAWVLEWLSLSFPGSMAFSWSMVGVRNKGRLGDQPYIYTYYRVTHWLSDSQGLMRAEDSKTRLPTTYIVDVHMVRNSSGPLTYLSPLPLISSSIQVSRWSDGVGAVKFFWQTPWCCTRWR